MIIFSSQAAFGQTAATDTTVKPSASSAGISVTITRDSSADKNDTLGVAQDTTGNGEDTLSAKKDTLEILTSNASYDTVPGFRVQLMSTQNLSEAIGAKANADSLLSGYNVYIVYDSPYYKVRVGDFRARYEANQAVAYITGHGFPNAWAVPDNVFRNPPKKGN